MKIRNQYVRQYHGETPPNVWVIAGAMIGGCVPVGIFGWYVLHTVGLI